jgi:hypothetical protein
MRNYKYCRSLYEDALDDPRVGANRGDIIARAVSEERAQLETSRNLNVATSGGRMVRHAMLAPRGRVGRKPEANRSTERE